MSPSIYVLGPLLSFGLLSFGWAMTQTHWWRRRRATRRSPRRLFDELATAHRLSASQRRDCREVAEELSLEDVAGLFVRPEARGVVAKRNPKLAERLYGADPAITE